MWRVMSVPNLLLPSVTDGATGYRKLPLIPLNGHCNKQLQTERTGNVCPHCHIETHAAADASLLRVHLHLLPLGAPPTSSNQAFRMSSMVCWSRLGRCNALQRTQPDVQTQTHHGRSHNAKEQCNMDDCQ